MQGTQFNGVDVALAYLYFCHGTPGQIAAAGLKLRGKLFLRQTPHLPSGLDLPPYDCVIHIVHAATSHTILSAPPLRLDVAAGGKSA